MPEVTARRHRRHHYGKRILDGGKVDAEEDMKGHQHQRRVVEKKIIIVIIDSLLSSVFSLLLLFLTLGHAADVRCWLFGNPNLSGIGSLLLAPQRPITLRRTMKTRTLRPI